MHWNNFKPKENNMREAENSFVNNHNSQTRESNSNLTTTTNNRDSFRQDIKNPFLQQSYSNNNFNNVNNFVLRNPSEFQRTNSQNMAGNDNYSPT